MFFGRIVKTGPQMDESSISKSDGLNKGRLGAGSLGKLEAMG